MKISKFLPLLIFLPVGVLLIHHSYIAEAGPYVANLKDHGHTGPGDGGVLSNVNITGGNATYTFVAGGQMNVTGSGTGQMPSLNFPSVALSTAGVGFYVNGSSQIVVTFLGNPIYTFFPSQFLPSGNQILGSIGSPWTGFYLNGNIIDNGTTIPLTMSETLVTASSGTCGTSNTTQASGLGITITPKSTTSRFVFHVGGMASRGTGSLEVSLMKNNGLVSDFFLDSSNLTSGSTYTISGIGTSSPASVAAQNFKVTIWNNGAGSASCWSPVSSFLEVTEYEQ